jgi:uncharacterized protein (TIGR00730 family)
MQMIETPPDNVEPQRPSSPDPEETHFLEGPHDRREVELFSAVRIFLEFIRGFRKFHFLGPCVTVFGSARFTEDHPYYQLARDVGYQLAKKGFTVVTGGGPGIMEAANRGAKEAGGITMGANIRLAHEQQANRYLDHFMTFKYFFVRKVMLVKYSYAFIVLPGGLGTLDEVFETATLVQTHKIRDFPIVILGQSFWQPMLDFLRETLVSEGTIDAMDLHYFYPTDDPAAAAEYVRDIAIRKFGLRYAKTPGAPKLRKRRWWLFE